MPDLPERFEAAVDAGDSLVKTAEAEGSSLAFARSVAAGLGADPKWLQCQYLYDKVGSELFERITEQPEYYPTRTETQILAESSAEIAEITGPLTLVELGSGFSVKTEHLLNAYVALGIDVHYVPVDVSASALRGANDAITDDFPSVQVTGINGPYESAFPVFELLSPQLVIFLGSTIGNFNAEEAGVFWRGVSEHLPLGNYFLLGIDLVKDPKLLEAAYNDAAGVTAQFTRNLWARINRELGASVDLDVLEHVAVWSEERSRMEISTRFTDAQRVYIEPLNSTFEISPGEQVLIEISRKFRLSEIAADLKPHGFNFVRSFTDPNQWFALLLLQRSDDGT